jgi:hypothetical protein
VVWAQDCDSVARHTGMSDLDDQGTWPTRNDGLSCGKWDGYGQGLSSWWVSTSRVYSAMEGPGRSDRKGEKLKGVDNTNDPEKVR